MRPVLLDRAARQDADLAQLDRVVDLGPGEFLVAIFGRCLGWPWSKVASVAWSRFVEGEDVEHSLSPFVPGRNSRHGAGGSRFYNYFPLAEQRRTAIQPFIASLDRAAS